MTLNVFTNSAPPTATRETSGVISAWRFLRNTIASTSKNAALRSIVPRFCGSLI